MNSDKSELLNALRIDRTAFPSKSATRWPWIAGGAAALVIAVLLAWLFVAGATQPVRVAVAQSIAKENGLAGGALLDATGYVVARREATVGPKIAGKLRDVLVEEGMHVAEGQVIAHLDDSNALAALDQAKASLDQAATAAADAQPVFARSRAQLAEGLISRDAFDTARRTFDEARTGAEVARSALAIARQNEDDTVVRAPFSGVVTAKAAQPGEIISPLSAGAGFTRTGIATIVDMDSLEVDVDVSENFINRVRADQPCVISLNAYPDWQIPGHVIAVVPTADRTKATVMVRVGLDTRDPRILPEMGARVSFLTEANPQTAPTARGVIVPRQAVTAAGSEGTLFVVQDGRVERRSVKLGARTEDGQLVLSGLSGGETVVVGGLDKLSDGAEVQVEQ